MVSENHVKLDGLECKVLLGGPSGDSIPLILLHGLRFTSEIWRKIGLLDKLESSSISYIAPDMPYGIYSECSTRSLSDDVILDSIRRLQTELLGDKPAILVGASIGGYYALLYAIGGGKVSGLILAAPASRRLETLEGLEDLDVPVLVLWGDKDRVVGRDVIERLVSRLSSAKFTVYEGAGHALYLDQPDRFAEDLISFHREVSRRRG
ncbi:MAG: alpha/beta hydrolase [Desulfurococcales archaeon]|nr:alpha/beta hydrolase [Desulfurococcales archaeon]